MRKETLELINKYSSEMRFLERTVETIELRETRLISSLSYFGNKKVSEVTVSDAKELRNALYFLPANYKKNTFFIRNENKRCM